MPFGCKMIYAQIVFILWIDMRQAICCIQSVVQMRHLCALCAQMIWTHQCSLVHTNGFLQGPCFTVVYYWIMLLQYIPRNMHTVFALLCFVVVIHWLIFPYPSGLLHWHCGNLSIAPVPAKQPWWIWINTSCEFIMNDCITTTKQSTTKPCASSHY